MIKYYYLKKSLFYKNWVQKLWAKEGLKKEIYISLIIPSNLKIILEIIEFSEKLIWYILTLYNILYLFEESLFVQI